MGVLFIKGNKVIYNRESYELNDMFNERLYEESNRNAESYENELCVVNEVFLNQIQPYKALEFFLSGLDIKVIKVEDPDSKLLPHILDFANNKKIKVKGSPLFNIIKSRIIGLINIMLSSIYLCIKMVAIPYSSKMSSSNNNISLIRTPAAKKKLAFLENVDFKYENFNIKDTIYNSFSKKQRLCWVFKSLMVSYKEINSYTKYIKETIGIYNSAYTFNYYSKRVVHTMLYEIILEQFFIYNKGKTFYTGNNLDRFAVIEEKTSKKYNMDIICIPHGLEYGFKLPHCFIGDVFYTTSLNASIHLNGLYKTKKFVFDPEVATKMFLNSYGKEKTNRDIVFFTEPRNIEVNYKIIERLLPLFQKENLGFYIKLHPKDKKADYERYSDDVKFIDDFSLSVRDNICISRKSTILLEAVYNNSDAAAILLNKKDELIFNNFPSLQDERINVFGSIETLFEWILKNKNQGVKP